MKGHAQQNAKTMFHHLTSLNHSVLNLVVCRSQLLPIYNATKIQMNLLCKMCFGEGYVFCLYIKKDEIKFLHNGSQHIVPWWVTAYAIKA